MQAKSLGMRSSSKPTHRRKCPLRPLLEEVQSNILETDELESQEKPHAWASFRILSQSSFH